MNTLAKYVINKETLQLLNYYLNVNTKQKNVITSFIKYSKTLIQKLRCWKILTMYENNNDKVYRREKCTSVETNTQTHRYTLWVWASLSRLWSKAPVGASRWPPSAAPDTDGPAAWSRGTWRRCAGLRGLPRDTQSSGAFRWDPPDAGQGIPTGTGWRDETWRGLQTAPETSLRSLDEGRRASLSRRSTAGCLRGSCRDTARGTHCPCPSSGPRRAPAAHQFESFWISPCWLSFWLEMCPLNSWCYFVWSVFVVFKTRT